VHAEVSTRRNLVGKLTNKEPGIDGISPGKRFDSLSLECKHTRKWRFL